MTASPGDGPKATLRPHFRARRRREMAGAQGPLGQGAPAWLAPLIPPGRHLGLYWPVGSEPDLRDLQTLATPTGGTRLALPAVRPAPEQGEPELVYLAWQAGEPLEPDACRIPAPLAGARRQPLRPEALALLLVPALAIDERGIRLGSGGGWYDRLRADPAWRRVPALAVLPACCVVPVLPSDPWDIPLDGWLCETGVHWLQR